MLGGLKAWVPGTARYSQKHHVKFLIKKARGHDVLLLIEWADGQLTEMPADYHANKDGWYVTPAGLMFANVGEGVDPVNYYGVQVVRCHAEIACPISTTAAIQSEYDEAGDFHYESDGQGNTEKVVQMTPTQANGNGNGDVAADGGHDVVREYDIRPPSPAVGHAFGLDEVKQRAPNPVTSNLVYRSFEYGKEMAREDGKLLRVAAIALGIGLGLALTVVGFLWLLNQLGGGGGGGSGSGGGGGGFALSMLLVIGSHRGLLYSKLREFVTGAG